jgi:penicillin-binding protein 1C
LNRFFSYLGRWKWTAAFLLLLVFWLFSLPNPLFNDPLSRVLEDRDGKLLAARIASDGQWRFPLPDTVPYRFEKCLLQFEDKRFFYHPGIDPLSLARAVVQNIKAGGIKSGGSTLTMQVVRLSRKGKPRTISEKIKEAWLATRLELAYSKKEILRLYAGHAPFGGNVVGLEAATWRFFGKKPSNLSWAEAATLAVLPNSPSLIHPGRNREILLQKRNRLLDRLLQNEILDSLSWQLALLEKIPPAPYPLPRHAPHLLDRLALHPAVNQEAKISTTIHKQLQIQVNETAKRHHRQLAENEIHNIAILVMEVESGKVLAYTGNIADAGLEHGQAVDIITAPRSSGSILKPLLYACMLDDGSILPRSLVPDVPINYAGYSPENYANTYDGLVPAQKAIVRSLNVPLVRMLEQYSLEKFHYDLTQKLGLSTFTRSATYYGLPLILGGGEINLEEITNTYACMARTLVHYTGEDSRYFTADFRPPSFLQENTPNNKKLPATAEAPILGAGAIWSTMEAMQQLERPDQLGNWKKFTGSRKIAWKTGTSFGFRDAWAVGVTPRYAVGVWVGNADGEGRPGLIGVQAAAPLLFDVFDLLPSGNWFEQPFDDMVQLEVCALSGDLATPLCPGQPEWVPKAGKRSKSCTRHKTIHLDRQEAFRVHSGCYEPQEMVHRPWFMLSPLEEHFFQSVAPDYRSLPPLHPDCKDQFEQINPVELIYPRKFTQIFVPRGFEGRKEKTVFKATHRDKNATIFWHIDQTFVGKTTDFHHLECAPDVGEHTLVLIDQDGNEIKQSFEIIEK